MKYKIKLTNICLILSGILLLIITEQLNAQNPIVPPGMYIADPSAHVWQDGKMYVYGSRDESPDYYCSHSHHVRSTSDMIHWEITKNAFASKGPYDQVDYGDDPLYAPDCQYFNGTYYLYYCLANVNHVEGVATSNSPMGPFTNGKNIPLNGINQIDPSVFIDDDGQVYYIWGQFTAKMAKMKPNMLEIDFTTIRDSVLTEKEHYFHEGGFLTKKNDTYYFIYADMSRADMPTCIGYATSKSPMGPYAYGGVIVDNDHCDPGNWNNHGSIAEFNGQCYVFYHRATHGSKTMRKACVEPIYFNEDGSINEVEMTSQGAGPPLTAKAIIEAERACLFNGHVRIHTFDVEKEALEGIRNDDKAVYKYVDFGKGVSEYSFRVLPGISGGKIEIALDQSWGKANGSIDIPANKNDRDWITIAGNLEQEIKGVHALWLRFYCRDDGDDTFKVDWFEFNASEL